MAADSFKGQIKNVHVGSKATKDKLSGEIKPIEGNLMDIKFVTDIKVGVRDTVEYRKRKDGSAEIVKIIKKAK